MMLLRRYGILFMFGALSFAEGQRIPVLNAPALDGHSISLPRDLPAATVLIIGFGRHSDDATTAWEKSVRATLASSGIGYYDMAFIGDAPAFVRPMIMRLIRNKVPAIVHPNFVVLSTDEDTWKQMSQYDSAAPDAAYVLLIDRDGNIVWKTHAVYTAQEFSLLKTKAIDLARK